MRYIYPSGKRDLLNVPLLPETHFAPLSCSRRGKLQLMVCGLDHSDSQPFNYILQSGIALTSYYIISMANYNYTERRGV